MSLSPFLVFAAIISAAYAGEAPPACIAQPAGKLQPCDDTGMMADMCRIRRLNLNSNLERAIAIANHTPPEPHPEPILKQGRLRTFFYRSAGKTAREGLYLVTSEVARCGPDTHYSVIITDQLGRPLSPACFHALLGNVTPPAQTTMHAVQAACARLPPDYGTMIISACAPTSGAAITHAVFMFLAFGVAIPLAYGIGDSTGVAPARRLFYCFSSACIVIALFAGAFAPELNRGLTYESMSWLLVLTTAGRFVYGEIVMKIIPAASALSSETPSHDPEPDTDAHSSGYCCRKRCTPQRVFLFLRWAQVFVLAPLCFVFLIARLVKACAPDRIAHVYTGNNCPGHVGVGWGVFMYGVAAILFELRAFTPPCHWVTMESSLIPFGASLLWIATAALNSADRPWPWAWAVADFQHLALYSVLIVFPLTTLAVRALKVKPLDWNFPTLFAAAMMMFLFLLHDPESHGIHKMLHVCCGATWGAGIIARAYDRMMVVGFAACIAGALFSSVTLAMPMMYMGVDYLGYYLNTTVFVAFVLMFIVLMTTVIRFINPNALPKVEAGNGPSLINTGAAGPSGKYGRVASFSLDEEM